MLKKNYLHHRVGTLRDDPATEELGHANEYPKRKMRRRGRSRKKKTKRKSLIILDSCIMYISNQFKKCSRLPEDVCLPLLRSPSLLSLSLSLPTSHTLFSLLTTALSDYQILTDRHNIRKIDSILQKDKGEPSQEDFMMFLQKRDKLLVVKREGNPLSTIVGYVPLFLLSRSLALYHFLRFLLFSFFFLLFLYILYILFIFF